MVTHGDSDYSGGLFDELLTFFYFNRHLTLISFSLTVLVDNEIK